MTRISFIVPTFNRAHFIGASLASILDQMSADDEILVIDDGSTDATADVVRAADPRIRYVRQDNSGKSAALNHGMRITDGQFVWICDDDDLLRREAVPLLFGELNTSGAEFAFGRYSRFQEEKGEPVDLGTGYWPDLSQGTIQRHIMEDMFILQNASLVKRQLYDRVGSFNETLFRSIDYEMSLRLATASAGHYVDALIYDQRQHDGPRGPAQARHAAADSVTVWVQSDRRIFTDFMASLDLGAFTSMFEAEDSTLLNRAALLQRGCVSARHDLWAMAIDDLEAAARLCAEKPLTKVERAICRRMVSGKYGFAGALEPQIIARLSMLRRSSPMGAALVRAMLAGLLWHARRGDPRDRTQARTLLWRLGGVVHTSRTLAEHLAQPAAVDTELRERHLSRSLPHCLRPGYGSAA